MSALASTIPIVVVDVDNDCEFVPDSNTCPFLPLSPETILCMMQWFRYVRRFGTTETTAGHVSYFLTDTYHEFLGQFHIETGHSSAAAVAINVPMHFTMDEVSYDTVHQRFTEFIQYVYKDPTDTNRFAASRIPDTYYCWRDLVMFMAVQATDEVCRDIVHLPCATRALVCELAKRMNSPAGLCRFKDHPPATTTAESRSSSCSSSVSCSDDDE